MNYTRPSTARTQTVSWAAGAWRRTACRELYQRYCKTYGDDNNVGYCDVAESYAGQASDARRSACMVEGSVEAKEMVEVLQGTGRPMMMVNTARGEIIPTRFRRIQEAAEGTMITIITI